MLNFTCSSCGKQVEAPDTFAGRSAICPVCDAAVTAPPIGSGALPTTAIATIQYAHLAKITTEVDSSDGSFQEGLPPLHGVAGPNIRSDTPRVPRRWRSYVLGAAAAGAVLLLYSVLTIFRPGKADEQFCGGCGFVEGEDVLLFVFTDHGTSLTIGTKYGNLQTIDVESGKGATIALPGFGDKAALDALALSPDGKKLAAWERPGTIVLWDLANGMKRHVLTEQAGNGASLSFSPDGRTLASGGKEKLALWDVATREMKASWAEPEAWKVSCIAFAPNGHTLAYGIWGPDKNIKVRDLRANKEIASLPRENSSIYCLAFSPDSKTLAVGNQRGGPVELWDLETTRQLPDLHSHGHNAVFVTFAPDGKTLASGGMDGAVKIWDWRAQVQLNQIDARAPPIVAFSPDGKTLAVLGTREGLTVLGTYHKLTFYGVQGGRVQPMPRGEQR